MEYIFSVALYFGNSKSHFRTEGSIADPGFIENTNLDVLDSKSFVIESNVSVGIT